MTKEKSSEEVAYYKAEAELSRIRKEIEELKKKIETRRESIETKGSTLIAKKKEEARIEAIDDKITNKTATIDKTIDYYKTEIQKAEQKMEEDKTLVEKKMENEVTILRQKLEVEIDRLQRKYDIEKKKFEDKFYNYRNYCMTFISSMEEKRALITDPLEKKKETLQQMMDKSEDDDAYLVTYKINLRKLQEEEKMALEKYYTRQEEFDKNKEIRRRTQEAMERAELQRLKQIQDAKDARDRELIYIQRQQEKAAEEERWEQQKEERKKQIEEEQVKKKQQETARSHYSNFTKNLYPSLSEEFKAIYNFIKADSEQRHKEAWTLDTKEEVEDYLAEFQGDYDTIQSFEENNPELDSNSDYQNKSIQQKIKYIQLQGKKEKEKKKPTSKSVIALSSLPIATR